MFTSLAKFDAEKRLGIENDYIKFSLMFKDILFKIEIQLFDKIKNILSNNNNLPQKLDTILLMININKLKSDIYIVQLETKKGLISKKIFIRK